MYTRTRLAPDKVMPVTRVELFRSLAVINYMGMVKLPAKSDYFLSDDSVLPVHHTIHLSRERFKYIWRNVHTAFKRFGRLDEGDDTRDSGAEGCDTSDDEEDFDDEKDESADTEHGVIKDVIVHSQTKEQDNFTKAMGVGCPVGTRWLRLLPQTK
jgi:hypothetical protein